MSWLRLDDGFTKHPKFEGWTGSQKWAWLEVMEYCARYQTDGRVPDDLSIMPRSTTKPLLDRAENAGWCERQTDGALWINDWAIYNPKDPTKAVRQAKWRAKRDGLVDDCVDGLVDGLMVSTEASTHARASAPVPVPSPIVKTSSVSNNADDDESILMELHRLASNDQQALDWRKAFHDNPDRVRSCLATAKRDAKTNVGGYLNTLIANGSTPHTEKPTNERILNACLRWVASPAFDPETMDEDSVLDEIRNRETRLRGQLTIEQRHHILDTADQRRTPQETH